MTYIEERIKPCFWGVVAVGSSAPVICSGTIEQIQNFGATHSNKKPANPCVYSIIAQSPVTTQANRGLFGAAFGAIGGAA
jgi:hypothetical protein